MFILLCPSNPSNPISISYFSHSVRFEVGADVSHREPIIRICSAASHREPIIRICSSAASHREPSILVFRR